MSDGAMVIEMADRLFADIAGDAATVLAGGEWPAHAWNAVEEMGLPLALVPEDSDGFGMAPADALALIRRAAHHALPLPLAETMIANYALARAGLERADGPASFLPANGADMPHTAARLPWGRHAGVIVVEGGDGRIARVTDAQVTQEGSDLANMPRDDMRLDPAAAPTGPRGSGALLLWGAAMRTLQIAGAMERVLMLTIGHVEQRQQFGRPLVKFQAIQHELAKLAGEVAAAGAAADMASEAMLTNRPDTDHDPAIAIAAARIRSGEAVGIATSIAQQLHGAIGFTREHRLHRYTTALWSWRDDYGGQYHWTQMLGGAAMAAGGTGFWPFVTEAA